MTTTMMGQTSSQPGPPSPQQSGAVADIMPGDTGPRKPKHRKDRKDRKSSEYGQVNADEEESARALLQMRDEAVNHVRRPSTEYDLAASSQLMNETYNTQPAASSEDDTSSKKRKRVGKGDPKRQKKRRQNTSDSRLQERTVSPIREDSPAAPAASDGTDGLDYLFNDLEEPSQSSSEPDNIHPLQSSHKLDDIHSDDGDVASLLQDYEQDEMSSFTFKKPHDQSHIEHHDTLNCTLPRSSPPSYDGALVKSHKNRKKKRKRHSGPSSDPHFEEDQTLPGVTGQHEFDIDFQAFDDFCAANGVGSANLFDDTPGQALPIDPVLMEEGELAHANNGVEENSEGDAATPRAQQAKRRRASLRSKRQAEDSAKMTVPLVSNDLLVDSLDLLNTDQQDQVLPGFEDMQRQSSQEYHPSRESSMASGRQSPLNETDVLEKVPASSRQKASTPKHKASQRKRKLHVSSPPAEDEAPKGGTYTIGEITKLEKVRENYCDEHKISEWQFNELIHNPVKGNSKAQTLWQEIYETLDYRTKHSLRRFCHRRFHNFGVRGAWTAEDDELLDHAVEEKGKSWVAVGQMMGRFEEDVRDRWRNYHVNAELRNTEKWLDSDVRNLAMAVDQCMHLMRDARLRALQEKYEGRDIPEAEWSQAQNVDDTKLINWQVVSDRMGGSKSRLQCSFKWGKLKDADRRRFMKEVKAARKAAIPQKPTKNPWRMTKAMKRAEQMRPGDKLELLEALSGCRALEKLSIPWQSLGSSDFTARWKTSDKKAAWQIMKRNFAAPDWMDYQDIVNRLLTMQLAGGENLDEKYDPEVHGYGRAPHPMAAAEKVESKKKKMKEKLEKQKSKRKAKHASKPRKADRASKVKSAVFVPESDIEDDEVQEPSLETEDRNSGTQSNSDSRRSSNGSGTQAHNEDAEAARTADTSVDGSEDEELPRSRQVSDDLAELLRSVRDA